MRWLFLVFLVLFVSIAAVNFRQLYPKTQATPASIPVILPTATTTPKILQPIDIYTPPQIKPAQSYTIIFVGDSMTAVMGENFDYLRTGLKKYYPDKVFGLFNYSFSSTNILSVEDRLHNQSDYLGKTYPPVLTRYFDIFILESLGHNPLSEFPLEQGLQQQTAALDRIVAQIVDAQPNAVIIFLATIAPSQTHYAKGSRDLSSQQRNQWANERRAYIENHINYANKHHIPLINVYEKSLDKNGQAVLTYINMSDFIHPSWQGSQLISQTIADYLSLNHILPSE